MGVLENPKIGWRTTKNKKEESMKKEEMGMQNAEDKHGRRSFLKHIYKYFLGFGAFTIASFFGFRRSGDVRLGKIKDIEFGISKANGTCGASYDCSGGGGECGASYNCGGGGGECGASYDCSGGGGQCGASYNCAGE